MLLKQSDEDIKIYADTKNCRRAEIKKFFPESKVKEGVSKCSCCDICGASCFSNHGGCILTAFTPPPSLGEPQQIGKIRQVSKEAKIQLREMLESNKLSLLPEPENAKFVSYPNTVFEFTNLQVTQAVNNCHKIFSLQDVKDNVEIWRNKYAANILAVIHHVFKDFEVNLTYNDFCGEEDHELDHGDNSYCGDSNITEMHSAAFEGMDCTDTDLDVSTDMEQQEEINSALEHIAEEANL